MRAAYAIVASVRTSTPTTTALTSGNVEHTPGAPIRPDGTGLSPRSIFSTARPTVRRHDDVRRADEGRDELGGRSLVDLGRWADLFDLAVTKDREPIAHRQGFLLIMRHENESDTDLALDPLELNLHLLAQLQVERAERHFSRMGHLVRRQPLAP